MIKIKDTIGVIGLGYVGLPLAIEFSKKAKVIGYDLNRKRISQLRSGKDKNREIIDKTTIKNKNLIYTYQATNLKRCNIFIVTVPTPVNSKNVPDLSLLKKACKLIGKYIKKNSIFILESTVYPGCTEDLCVPILEKVSKLKLNKDFYCGYSPERINPGDKKNNFSNIVKITSGSNRETSDKIKFLYQKIFRNIYPVHNIKIAEAAKVIENIQRDLNIALVNELSIIFDKLNINTNKVIDAAGTKWNFMKFYPGLVGGHCISVDPYYLTHISKINKYNPKIILAGRKVNNNMKYEVVKKFINSIKKNNIKIKKIKVLVMGISFKENVSDTRNSQALDIINILTDKKYDLDVYDPLITEKKITYLNKSLLIKDKMPDKRIYDAILILTPHDKIKSISSKRILQVCKKKFVIFDLKNYLNLKIKEYEKL